MTRVAAGSLLVIAAAILAAAVTPPAVAAGRWQRPVAGPLARPFDYGGDPFAAGRHRGVDFAVRPGEPVRSACAGRVVFAGTAGASGPTVRCAAGRGGWPTPAATLAVRSGAGRVAPRRPARQATAGGARRPPWYAARPRGTARRPAPRRAPRGPALGLRRSAAVLRCALAVPVPIGPLRARSTRPRGRAERPHDGTDRCAARRPGWSPVIAPDAGDRAPAGSARPVAPWLAWAGLALVLAGASGAGISRRRRAPYPAHSAIGPARRRRADVAG